MGSRSIVWGVVAAVCVASAGVANACMWDYDTLQMERRRFPQALELVTGKFLRHSEAYYRWRVADRERRIADEPSNAQLYDDLAVAYDKLGEHAEAIETILKVEAFEPGRYETFANLGTFHVHGGDFEQGLEHLRKAVEINPDAHFGREIYQILLVEYLLSKQAADGTLPQPLTTEERWGNRTDGFAEFVVERREIDRTDAQAMSSEISRAVKGVLGMMRFGKHDSPVLLEAIGDLLLADGQEDGKLLAVRAYLAAAREAQTEVAREEFRKLAEQAVKMQHEVELTDVETEFARELGEAEAWYAEVRANEQRWVDEGADVDEKFTATYYEEPRVDDPPALSLDPAGLPLRWKITIGAVLLLTVGALVVLRLKRPALPER